MREERRERRVESEAKKEGERRREISTLECWVLLHVMCFPCFVLQCVVAGVSRGARVTEYCCRERGGKVKCIIMFVLRGRTVWEGGKASMLRRVFV